MKILLYVFHFAFLLNFALFGVAGAEEKQNNTGVSEAAKLQEVNLKERNILNVTLDGDYNSFVNLLDEGAIDPNMIIIGRPLTIIALNKNLPEKFEKLIEMGADPNTVDSRNRTLLMLAAHKVRPELVRILLASGKIKTYEKDADGKTALDYVKDFDVGKASTLKSVDKRDESTSQLISDAKLIYESILNYQRNSVLAVDEDVLFRYIPSSFVPVLKREVLGIPVWRFVISFILLIIIFIFNNLLQVHLNKIAEKHRTKKDDNPDSVFYFVLLAFKASIKFLIRWFGVYFVLAMLAPAILDSANWAFDVIITIAVAIFCYNLSAVIESLLLVWLDKSELNISEALSSLIRKSIRVIIVVSAGLHIYSLITGSSVTTLIAGLGIGGMAVALAATDTLKNFLGFITIITDRPFVIGERVEIKGYDGVVEHIGMRTTRIRRLDGHQVSIPNSSTVSDAVRNIDRRPYLKKEISVTVTYDTPVAKVEKALQIVKDILQDHEGMSADRPPRVFFANMNSDNLEIVATYWYFPADWYAFCEFNEWVNFELMKRYEAEGIEFAFPTQTLYLADDPSRRLVVQNTEYKP